MLENIREQYAYDLDMKNQNQNDGNKTKERSGQSLFGSCEVHACNMRMPCA